MPKPRKRPAPFSLRLTPEDREQLMRDAAGMSLGGYIHWRLFGADSPSRRRRRAPVKDQRALSEVVALLGQSRIASNLNQLAKATNSGSLNLTPEIELELREALQSVAQMRRLLIAALDLSEGAP